VKQDLDAFSDEIRSSRLMYTAQKVHKHWLAKNHSDKWSILLNSRMLIHSG